MAHAGTGPQEPEVKDPEQGPDCSGTGENMEAAVATDAPHVKQEIPIDPVVCADQTVATGATGRAGTIENKTKKRRLRKGDDAPHVKQETPVDHVDPVVRTDQTVATDATRCTETTGTKIKKVVTVLRKDYRTRARAGATS